jgi:hypothetical protein
MTLPGGPLTASDLAKLAASGVPRELAEQAQLRRVDSREGGAIVGRNGSGDYSGIVFPYIRPGQDGVIAHRLRRDHPDMEYRGETLHEKNKYLSPPGAGNKVYFVPGTPFEWLADSTLPVVITEGEKKALSLWALAYHGLGDAGDMPRFLPIGLPGVWNWYGTVGKTSGPDGDRRDVKGVIPDFDRIEWRGRRVTIVFDVNVSTNESVAAARAKLAEELTSRGAKVFVIKGGAIIDHETPDKRRFAAVPK